MKIVFFGTPAFSVPFLRALEGERAITVEAVVSQPDRPSGRGGSSLPTPVRAFAESRGLTVIQPERLKEPEIIERLLAYKADVFVVVAYGRLLPPALLHGARLGCVNVHPSLLPSYRGPSPMQGAIAHGETETGVSIMLLDEGMDTGPILAASKIPLATDETYASLETKVHSLGPNLLVQTLKRYANGEITPIPQGEPQTEVTHLLEKEDGHVNWNKTAVEIEREARAYKGWPGSWALWERNGKEMRLKLLDIRLTGDVTDLPPGTVIAGDHIMKIAAKDELLEVVELQAEGKPPIDTSSFLQGYSDINGAVLI